jgi:hypothetical protein
MISRLNQIHAHSEGVKSDKLAILKPSIAVIENPIASSWQNLLELPN